MAFRNISDRYKVRGAQIFARMAPRMDDGLSALYAEHSAGGRLRSGLTIIRAVELFGAETNAALDTVLEEASRTIRHRGKAWTAAMAGIDEALEDHLSSGEGYLASALAVAGVTSHEAATNAGQERLSDACNVARERFADYRDGWTSPAAMSWVERHPALFALASAAAGAILSEGFQALFQI